MTLDRETEERIDQPLSPEAERETRLPPIDGRTEHAMVWTGSEAVIWGGYESSPKKSG